MSLEPISLLAGSEFFRTYQPENGVVNLPTGPLDLLFSHPGGEYPLDGEFEYCIDTVNNNACDTSWQPTINNGWAAYFPYTYPNTTYYWQVRTGDRRMYSNYGTWSSFRTTSRSSNKPDVRVTGVHFTPASPQTGSSRLDVTVKNVGTATALRTALLSIFVDHSPNPARTGWVAGGGQDGALAVGEQITSTFYSLPELATGSHQIYAVFDLDNDLDELNENNNAYGPPQITHIEITQAIQDEANGVPLVARKPTYVRVYVDCNGCQGNRITGELYAYRNGNLLGSLKPLNEWIIPTYNPWPRQRGNIEKTLNFALSRNWSWGNVRLVVDVEGSRAERTITFNEAKPVRMLLVPIRYNGYQSSDFHLTDALSMARALYPTDVINYKILSPMEWQPPSGFFCGQDCKSADLTKRLNILYAANASAGDYLVGWLPAEAIDEVGVGGSSDPDWYYGKGKVAFIVDSISNKIRNRRVIHEVGHLLGRRHTNTTTTSEDPNCSEKAKVDPASDWLTQGYLTPMIQEWGLNGSDACLGRNQNCAVKNPSSTYDYMSYCDLKDPSSTYWSAAPTWTAGFTYRKIFEDKLRLDPPSTFRASAFETGGDYFLIGGLIFSDDTAELDPVWLATMPAPDNPPVGTDYCIELQDAASQILSQHCFDLSFMNYETGEASAVDGFSIGLPDPGGVVRIVLKKGELILAEQSLSTNRPLVHVVSPNGGETWDIGSNVTVNWEASDLDGDALTYNVLYSLDGYSWQTLGTDITETQLIIATNNLPGGGQALVRVMATDGINTSSDESDLPFIVAKKDPSVTIESPENNEFGTSGAPTVLRGSAVDLEDSSLPDSSLSWSSNLDGILGTGSTISVDLSTGQHTLTLTATDSDGNTATAQTSISIRDCYLLVTRHTGQGEDPALSPASSAGCPDHHFVVGEQVQLSGMPDEDWQVAAWTGTDDDASVVATNSLTMPADEHIIDVSYAGPIALYGNAGTEGVTLSYEKDGSVFSAITDASGNYVIAVPLHWSGVVTPSKVDYVFSPENKTYTALGEDLLEENYTAFNKIYFAKPGGVNSGTCKSWAQACDLQYALLNAVPGYEIWVAAGTYLPGTLRTDTFQLKNGVALYGGFTGVETSRDQRDPVTNLTILSGDLADDDLPNYTNKNDNSYHVVIGSGTDHTAVLDGFIVSGGYASGSIPDNSGGGMFNISGSPTLNNIIFSGNVARAGGGGGMYNENGNPVITNTVFDKNLAEKYSGWGGWGGGMYNVTSNPSIENVTFRENQARPLADWNGGWGGGIYNFQSSPMLINVTLYANQANSGGGIYNDQSNPLLRNITFNENAANVTPGWSGGAGGGIYNEDSDPELRNTILWGNTAAEGAQLYNDTTSAPVLEYSVLEGGCPAGSVCQYIILDDPLFGEIAGSGFIQTIPIASGGSAIDSGSNTYCPETDQRGKKRPDDGNADDMFVCDIGAFEYETALQVLSISRANSNPTDAVSISFIVTFTKTVTGVDLTAPFGDFDIVTTDWISDAFISAVSGSGRIYTVVVNTGSGNGTIRLDVLDDDSIWDAANNRLGGTGAGNGDFETGELYTIASQVSKPMLSLPSWNSIMNNSEPAFTWSEVTNAAQYEIMFAADSAFTQNVDSHFVPDPTFVFSTPLDNGKYYWHVRAHNIANQPGSWSTSRYFVIDTLSPATPVLRLPANNASVRSVPIFRWNSVSGAVLYQFELDNDENFSSPLVSINQRTTSRRPAGGLRGTYFWRVRAQDAAGNWSEWSDVFTVNILRSRR